MNTHQLAITALSVVAFHYSCTGVVGDAGGSYDKGPPDVRAGDVVVTPPGTGWLDNAWMNATVGARQAFLTWDGAEGQVLGYRVFVDGDLVGTTTNAEYLVESLEPATAYSFGVEAGYANDLWTSDGPVVTATTDDEYDPGFRRLTEEQFKRTQEVCRLLSEGGAGAVRVG